ncbi:hypothetical protein ACFLXE_00445 [Chloroflexota bacterium]
MNISIEALRDLVEKESHAHPHLTSRLEKAAFLLLLRPIVQVEQDHHRVMSEDGLKWYEVRDGHCECADFARHGPGHPCKHRLAIAFLYELKEEVTATT